MSAEKSYQGLKVTYIIGRESFKPDRIGFEPLTELQEVGKEMNAKVLASGRLTLLHLLSSGEALQFQGQGVYESQAEATLNDLKQKKGGKSLTLSSEVKIGDQVNVYPEGNDIHLGIPLIGTAAEQIVKEKDMLVAGLSKLVNGDVAEIEMSQSEPYLTVAIIKEGPEHAAGVLQAVSQDILWPENGLKPISDSVRLYAPQTQRVKTAVFA